MNNNSISENFLLSLVFVLMFLLGASLVPDNLFTPTSNNTKILGYGDVIKKLDEVVVEEPNKFDPTKLVWQEAAPSASWPARDSHAVYVFKNKLWLSGGLNADGLKTGDGSPDYVNAKYYNDIWSSDDGINWVLVKEHANFFPIRSASVIYFKNFLYMMGGWSPLNGYNNGIWKSEDGTNWSEVKSKTDWPEREGQKVVEFKGKLFLIGGVRYGSSKELFNDVWSSDDGTNWMQVASTTPWLPRWDHDVAILDNKMWLVGGMQSIDIGFSDVWYTEDGATWTLATDSAPWGRRQGHGMVNYKDTLWLVGGINMDNNSDALNSWFTTDGFNWQSVLSGPRFSREDHEVLVFKDKIWMFGGMDSGWHWNSDIWFSSTSDK